MIKQHVINDWELKLREKAAYLTSLEYFKPQFLSLSSPHSILTSAGPSPYFVTMANVQSVMLSGRYRTEALASHWSEPRTKNCKTLFCKDLRIVEDLKHILADCVALQSTRDKLFDFTSKYCSKIDILEIRRIINTYCSLQHPRFCQFLTDCSVLPDVINAGHVYGKEVVHDHLRSRVKTFVLELS